MSHQEDVELPKLNLTIRLLRSSEARLDSTDQLLNSCGLASSANIVLLMNAPSNPSIRLFSSDARFLFLFVRRHTVRSRRVMRSIPGGTRQSHISLQLPYLGTGSTIRFLQPEAGRQDRIYSVCIIIKFEKYTQSDRQVK
jgi:hypothetical protein